MVTSNGEVLSNFFQDQDGSALLWFYLNPFNRTAVFPQRSVVTLLTTLSMLGLWKISVINHLPILEYSIISTSHKAPPPSKLNRARQIPANRLQLQMRLVAWVAQPLRPLGTWPPDHLVINWREDEKMKMNLGMLAWIRNAPWVKLPQKNSKTVHVTCSCWRVSL